VHVASSSKKQVLGEEHTINKAYISISKLELRGIIGKVNSKVNGGQGNKDHTHKSSRLTSFPIAAGISEERLLNARDLCNKAC
jgi:hypothetical protein